VRAHILHPRVLAGESVDAATSFAASVNDPTVGDNGQTCILGLAVASQSKDFTADEVRIAHQLVKQILQHT
jgi:hypothetical protein